MNSTREKRKEKFIKALRNFINSKIAGGGRYDAGIGFAIGIERWILAKEFSNEDQFDGKIIQESLDNSENDDRITHDELKKSLLKRG